VNHKQTEKLFAIVSPGLEQICVRELSELGLNDLEGVTGGVGFAGRLAELYRVNLWLRTAGRIVVRFASFRCRDFPELYRHGCRLPWGRFVRGETNVEFRVTCRNSRLMHTTRVAETLRAAVDQSLGRDSATAGERRQLVLARIVDDVVELSIDSSGELLHRRGFRTHVAAAPLRETLAAGILNLLAWNGTEQLADPLCGTGTFLLEGALMATQKAPGLDRDFAFMRWPGWRPGLWQQLCEEARREEHPCPAGIFGADSDADALAAACVNLAQAGLDHAVTLEQRALELQPVHDGGGLVVCNPPYGKRLVTAEPLELYFAGLGRELQRAYPGWRKALLCPEPGLAKATGLPLHKVAELDNGGLRVGLYATKAGAGD
jgi:putative N6-adenine-specific DNA methylase